MKLRLISLATGIALGGLSGAVYAGAFGIGTQSGSGTGNAYSAGAAGAEDASAAWYNPASMAFLPAGKHVMVSGHLLRPSFKFRDEGSTIPGALGTGNGGDGGGWAAVPNAAFVMSLSSQLSFGLSVNSPFGLKTDYDAGWIGQRIGLASEILSVNINPALSYKVSPALSLGFGASVQYLEAELTNASALGTSKLKANDVGYGLNFGAMFAVSPSSRIGIAYRSSIDYKLEGGVSFSGVAAANANASADLRTPESVSFSFFTALDPKWDLMGDITWTRWSRVKAIVPTCQQVSAVVCAGGAGTPILGATLPTNWKDTWRVALGANYKFNSQWKLRMGVAYDPTPTNDVDRTARLPDQDRFWVAVGAQYAVSKQGRLEMGYAHEFVRDARVNTQVFGTAFRQVGHFEDKADILTIAYSHSF